VKRSAKLGLTASNSLGFAHWRLGRSLRPDGCPQKLIIAVQGGYAKLSPTL